MRVKPPYLYLVALLAAGASCERAPTDVDEFETAPEWVATVDLEIAGLDDERRGFLAPDEMHVRGANAYLLHGRERRIRVFDRATGDRLRTLVGPDEMQSPRGFGGFGGFGDTLWVSDNLPEPMFRLFAAETGGVIGEIRVGEWRGGRGASPSGRVTGTRLAPGGEMVASPAIASEQVVRGEVRERVLLHMSVSGEILDTLATVSVERGTLGFVQDGGGGIYAGQPFSDDPLYAFSPDLGRLAVLDREVIGRDTPQASLTLRSRRGETGFTRTVEYRPGRIDPGWIDAVIRFWQAELGMPYSHSEPLIRERLHTPDHTPVASEMRVDADGRVWLRAWDLSDAIRRYDLRFTPPEASRWLVIGPDGGSVARVRLPAEVRWLYAYGDALWATRTDGDGAGVVVRYRLSPATGALPGD